MTERNYINKIAIKEKTFDNGGSVLNISVAIEELQNIANEEGWARFTIAPRNPSKVHPKGYTHFAYEDTYKPKEDVIGGNPPTGEISDDVPF